MTGIERLRKLSEDMLNLSLWVRLTTGTEKDWDCCQGDGRTVNDELLSIAGQIERERACDEDAIENVRLIVGGVIDDMEHHVSGVEGAEDSPVARWARELREALGGDGRDHAADVSVSAYDLLPQEDREAIAWVREHGWLDAVKRRWECLSYYADPVPRSCMEKRLARLQRQIDESHAALRRRNQRIGFLVSELNRANHENHEEFMRRAGDYTAFTDEVCKRLASELRYMEGCSKNVMDAALNALDRRLMPEGMEWMLWDDGKPVTYDDAPDDVIGVYLALDGSGYLLMTDLPDQLMSEPGERVERPVLDADGVRIKNGDTVYEVEGTGHAYKVVGIRVGDGDPLTPTVVTCDEGDGTSEHFLPSQLTHEPPDSWERIEEDAGCTATKYNERRGTIFTTKQQVARDLVRRCRALAERERGE